MFSDRLGDGSSSEDTDSFLESEIVPNQNAADADDKDQVFADYDAKSKEAENGSEWLENRSGAQLKSGRVVGRLGVMSGQKDLVEKSNDSSDSSGEESVSDEDDEVSRYALSVGAASEAGNAKRQHTRAPERRRTEGYSKKEETTSTWFVW